MESDLSHATDPIPGTRFILGLLKAGAPESYSIRRQGATYTALANDPIGAMYGGLDLADAIRLGTLVTLADSEHQPYIARRGIKFNIPLDVRTPSYSDAGNCSRA